MTAVALLGLGAMGARMAERVRQAGYDLTVYNRNAERCKPLVERGVRAAATPSDAVADADVILTVVSDDEASRTLWVEPDGGLNRLRARAIVIECSTVTPTWIAELGALVDQAGARLLDAPIAGSRADAEAGTFPFLVGGEAETLAEVRELLLSMARVIHHIGPLGAGARMKLAANSLLAIQLAALGEALRALEQAGIDRKAALDVLTDLPVASPALQRMAGWIAVGDHSPRFPITLTAKDLRYAVATAHELDVEVPLTAAASASFERACGLGLGAQNISAIVELHAPQAGASHDVD